MVKKKKKSKDIDAALIKKAARLLKGEHLTTEQHDAYRLHAQRRIHFKRLKIHIDNRNEQWSIDLADLKSLLGYNDQYRYLLVCVDIATRYAFVRPLKNKSANNVRKKFEQIINEAGEAPKKIQADEGTEFNLIKKDFTLFHTQNRETKAVHAERFIRTFKQMIMSSLTTLNLGYRYIKYLPAILERYNESPNRGIFGARPVDLYVHQKVPKNFQFQLIKRDLNTHTQPTTDLLRKGTRVRIARVKNNTFEKSSLRRWVKEIFVIYKVYITDPVTYKLRDSKGEDIGGIFYRQELQTLLK
ncbi:uncharacterized transposon-derived [Paramuricea clavata]|uniref:Uncharacterized transposon-derived n=1 Tax=Paramuricea clavata TaxID=317549 RepID=A0A7D9DCE2_PARCT|nr:uncharacterized transposon-derived [Paramuricea clavata]